MTRQPSDAWILNRIHTLSPQNAQLIIEQAETAKLRWSPAVMKALLERAGAPPQALPEPATAYEVEDAAEIQDTHQPLPPVSSRSVNLKITSRESATPPEPPAEDFPF